eukprot:gnl/MRDRNA2_/MRDRNA2_121048_c0_seq1.p1 gnl/MRDRNA2_/MRDRNA2_121048_c0~~gnl/MRDRNA2_/MRDRNA2_121048_c0_seq1.p1  ORF type:complete len:481 (-),score=105.50 gnl/MRDRNA2_/MRDRNA2_121048_c0_seq1:607-1938(-)
MTDFFTSTLMAGDDHDAMMATNAATRDDTSSDSEDNGPRKRRLHGHKKKTRKEIFQQAVKELDGEGTMNFCMAITSFILACAANVIGVFTPWEEIDGTYRSFCLMAAVFMINQSFMFVKTVRDGELTSMKDHHGRIPPEFHFLQGGMPGELAPHRAVCFGCLAFSVVAEAYGIAVMDAKRYTQMFIALSSLYVLSASLNLGWLLRDKFEAEVWKEEAVDRFIGSNKVELALRNMMKVLANMQHAIKFMFLFIGACAITITVYAIIDFGVKEKGVGLISAAMVFSCASAWSMAQALNEESLQDKAHRMHQCATMVFFGLSVSLTVAGLIEMEIEWEKRIVLGLGVLIILDATLNFAKVVYRVSKVKKIFKKINKGFHLNISMEDASKSIFDSALDTFATATMDAGRQTGPYAGYVYGDAHGGGPPPPPQDGHGGYAPGGYEPMY